MNLTIKRRAVSACLFAMTLLCGCAAGESAEEQTVLLERDSETPIYEFVQVATQDVVKSQKIRCTYNEVEAQELSFSLSGKIVTAVYVEQGDTVKKGTLLATLSNAGIEERMETLTYQIQRNKVYLDSAQLNEDYEISARWLQFLYQSGQSAGEREALNQAVESIQQTYRYRKEDWQDAIALDEMELAKLQEELSQSSLYAGMDGVVSWVMDNLEGSTSAKDEAVFQITDPSSCLFVVEGMESASSFSEGVEVSLSITSGTGAGTYRVVPYQIDSWEDSMLFTFAEGEINTGVTPGERGTLQVILEQKSNVLTVPVGALHSADGESYVYVEGENGMREVRWISVGLIGDDSVEILSGLSEGEKVIIK